MAYWNWRRITIGIGGIEPLLVGKILGIYIAIGSVKPLVFEKIFACS